jgi:methylenetetrahydrofolate dehydrogenase (NADP+)/methenyltetrahydrofolate cyclohydrolase
MAEIIDGKLVSRLEKEKIKAETDLFREKYGIAPGLAVILVGNDPASAVYVRNKHKACLEVGFRSFEITMPETTTEDELIGKIYELNQDINVHGILVQLPLPRSINEWNVINAIDPRKDVDAFHPSNVGKIMIGNYSMLPCTPSGIITLLDHYGIEISGKRCVVVGRSNIVGKPIAHLLLERNGTVTVCHSRTKDISAYTKMADIIIVAVGKRNLLTRDMIGDNRPIVIDVGINRNEEGKLCGDCDYENLVDVCEYVSPVPGGVGLLTRFALMSNVVKAVKEN